MTTVYVAPYGMKYHVEPWCESFAEGERERGRPVITSGRPLAGISADPCAVCWPRSPEWDPWRQLEHKVEQRGDSRYEVDFVRLVLRHVPELRPDEIQPQRRVDGASGRSYFADFFLSIDGGPQLVLEVDGYDKSSARSPQQIRSDGEARSADLTRAGFRVLHFSNDEVTGRSADAITRLRSELQSAAKPRPAQVESVNEAVRPELFPVSPGRVLTHSSASGSASTSTSRIVLFAIVAVVVLVIAAIAAVVSSSTSTKNEPASVQSDGSCPEDAPIKGNVSQSGDRIYHLTGWEFYSRTVAEECFATPADAEEAGYRPSEVQ